MCHDVSCKEEEKSAKVIILEHIPIAIIQSQISTSVLRVRSGMFSATSHVIYFRMKKAPVSSDAGVW